MPIIHHEQKLGMGTFRKGLTTSPFQIPFMVYLFLQGIIIALSVPTYVDLLGVPAWPIWNLAGALIVGGALATFSRFNENQRLETLGLWLIVLAGVLAMGIETAAKDYAGLGDDLAIMAGSLLRIRVLRKSRKAQKMAIEIAIEQDGETP